MPRLWHLFTAEYDFQTKKIPFLDVQISIENGKFVTDLFKKETAVCQYLLLSSCHPAHQTKSIIYSLAFRLRRLCSNDETFETRLQELKNDLISRQYHPKLVDLEFLKARKVTRAQALIKVSKTKTNRSILALTYHPGLPSVSRAIRKHYNVMVSLS